MIPLSETLRRAVGITPSPRQLAWQQLEFYAFIHYGPNTYTDQEWGDGTADPALFNPDCLDPDQWVQAARAAGMRGLILTCKHHDGFCLWPTRQTDYSVASSPWQNGQGDVVRMTADACRRAGLKFGVYLSPWDRHEPSYGSGEAYDRFYIAQLTELLTQYGEIFCVWLDGACGEGPNGRLQRYNWDAYYRTVRQLQPNAVISVTGPDVRWCGNEAGHCRESEWSVVPAALSDPALIAAHSQQVDDGTFSRRVTRQDEDLGSRAVLEAAATPLIWYPAEVNTSIRPGWFYHTWEDDKVRTPEELFSIYMNSVGGNAGFLLNLPPMPNGRLNDRDVASLEGLGRLLEERLGHPMAAALTADSEAPGHAAPCAEAGAEGFWKPEEDKEAPALTLHFAQPVQVGYVSLREDLMSGQRIEAGEILTDGKPAAAFTVVGARRLCRVDARCTELTVRILQSRGTPTLREFTAFEG